MDLQVNLRTVCVSLLTARSQKNKIAEAGEPENVRLMCSTFTSPSPLILTTLGQHSTLGPI